MEVGINLSYDLVRMPTGEHLPLGITGLMLGSWGLKLKSRNKATTQNL